MNRYGSKTVTISNIDYKYFDISELINIKKNDVSISDENWSSLSASKSTQYDWKKDSTYIKKPPFFDKFKLKVNATEDIFNARVLLMLTDSVTTDHISPAGEIPEDYPAGRYLKEKVTQLLGVKAVIAQSYERIRRSNLIGMGVLPLQFINNQSWKSLGLDGTEIFNITGIKEIKPRKQLRVKASKNGSTVEFKVSVRLDTGIETAYFKNGGILQYSLRSSNR